MGGQQRAEPVELGKLGRLTHDLSLGGPELTQRLEIHTETVHVSSFAELDPPRARESLSCNTGGRSMRKADL